MKFQHGLQIQVSEDIAVKHQKVGFQVLLSVLYGTGGGFVVYGELGKTYSWNRSTKASKSLIDSAPNQVMLSGNTMYFVMGASKAVYRLGLN